MKTKTNHLNHATHLHM